MNILITYILQVIIAGTISYFLYQWIWWTGTVAFPIFMMFGKQAWKRYIPKSKYRSILDAIIMIVHFAYVISQIIIFHLHIGSWYGWLIGLIVGWLLMGLMTPLRWKHESRMNI